MKRTRWAQQPVSRTRSGLEGVSLMQNQYECHGSGLNASLGAIGSLTSNACVNSRHVRSTPGDHARSRPHGARGRLAR